MFPTTERPRPKDRYADGRESARLLLALANEALTVAEIARKAAKDFDETKALICALRRQGKIQVDTRTWQARPCRDGHTRKREVAYYRVIRADKAMQSPPQSCDLPR